MMSLTRSSKKVLGWRRSTRSIPREGGMALQQGCDSARRGVTSCLSPPPSRPSSWIVRSTFCSHPGGHIMSGRRFFHSESDFHTAADETLDGIQDAIDAALEDKGVPDFEVTFASGVLTLVFPPHGTWVINKQTPNRQLWWSSPMSGPRRYEYEDGEWVFTRDDSHSMTLEKALEEEVKQIYDVKLDL